MLSYKYGDTATSICHSISFPTFFLKRDPYYLLMNYNYPTHDNTSSFLLIMRVILQTKIIGLRAQENECCENRWNYHGDKED